MRKHVAATALLAVVGACLPGAGPPLEIYMDDAGPAATISLVTDGGVSGFQDVDLGSPFAVIGLTPSHGPWTGGTRATLRGRGFASTLRVWVGGVELLPSAILASDPTTAAIETPAGTPGPADVKIRDDATAQESTLAAGFYYDAFVVEPSSGSTTGGTLITLLGNGTSWDAATTVTVDGKPCAGAVAQDATHLTCTTPADTPGAKDVLVSDGDGGVLPAREAFTYSDSTDGYRGGLSGGALAGSLKVIALDDWTGQTIPGAYVIGGGDITSAIRARTDAAGVALLTSAHLTGSVTVTVAAKCHQPLTFVNVPVDTVTAYLVPTLDPSCAQGGYSPSTGNYGGSQSSSIQGELVWPGGIELKRPPWKNVPAPVRANEHQVAYVFAADGSPKDTFNLPPATSATTPMSGGTLGYAYTFAASPGNVTVYALAGIEDRSVTPPLFTAYVMGVARGVPVDPNTVTTGVDIPMTTLLDHAVTLTPLPPAPTERGPDRLVSVLAVTLGASAYAILPTGSLSVPLPVSGSITLAGLPALDGTLTNERYMLTAGAVTGPNWSLPASIISGIATTNTNTPIALGGFLSVPVINQPGNGSWSGKQVDVGTIGQIDLLRVDVTSGNGLVTWTILSPGGTTSFGVPDLSTLPDNVGLVRGPLSTSVYVARMSPFDYGNLRTGQTGTAAWSAYAADRTSGTY